MCWRYLRDAMVIDQWFQNFGRLCTCVNVGIVLICNMASFHMFTTVYRMPTVLVTHLHFQA